jgi:2-polyprenyl-3-methyl-5-hydroxy-6-metoxy-1,4-benzoquinol methylase
MTFQENDIRPVQLMADKQYAIEADVRFLLNNQDRFVVVSCPACGQSRPRSQKTKNGFSYVLCSACETVYMNPRASQELMNEFYVVSQNYEYWNKYIYPATELVRRQSIIRPRAVRSVQLCREYGTDTGKLLEIGAADGTFCEEVRDVGNFRDVVALEPTPDLADTCRKRGIATVQAPLESASLAQDVDVIVAWEVIEHIFDPFGFLQHCRNVLRPGGLMIVSCPNVKGLDTSVLGVEAQTFDHEHVNYYHPSSLSLVFDRAGFDVLETFTPGNLDVELLRKRLVSGDISEADEPFLYTALVRQGGDMSNSFQDFVRKHGWSSNQWCVARRREVVC